MKIFLISELLRLTRSQLLELEQLIVSQLPALPEDAIECREALANLETIRRLLNQPLVRPRLTSRFDPAP